MAPSFGHQLYLCVQTRLRQNPVGAWNLGHRQNFSPPIKFAEVHRHYSQHQGLTLTATDDRDTYIHEMSYQCPVDACVLVILRTVAFS